MAKDEAKEEEEFSGKKISVWLNFGWARMIAAERRRQPSDLQNCEGDKPSGIRVS
jgi:hypothetical protein